MINIVSGLPRSGTSMMMQMLEVGGLPPLTDNLRKADDDNPRGYYEMERVKKIKEDKAWLDEAEGKAVKMISMLLYDLPQDRSYKIIFMQRAMSEILASQTRMLENLGKAQNIEDSAMRQHFESHLTQIHEWLNRQKNMDVLYSHYSDVVEAPGEYAVKICEFLGLDLDIDKMAGQVDKSLYRQRKDNI